MLIYSIFLLSSAFEEFDLIKISGISNSCNNGGWVKVYQQDSSSLWHHTAKNWCKSLPCSYSPFFSTDYLNFDIVPSYEGNGYAFLIVWDDGAWIQWKQKDIPTTLSADSKPDPLSGDFEFTLVASKNILSWGTVDFHGLSQSWDGGVILDGRSAMGTWFAIGVTDATSTDISQGIPGWITNGPLGTIRYWAKQVKLYVWDPSCGNWGNFPTESPTTQFPSVRSTIMPTFQPNTPSPTVVPSFYSAEIPTITSMMPSKKYSSLSPTNSPTPLHQTEYPTLSQTGYLTPLHPTEDPTTSQTGYPTLSHPTEYSTFAPTSYPTTSVSDRPSEFRNPNDFIKPTFAPTSSPTLNITLQEIQERSSSSQLTTVETSSILWLSTGFILGCFIFLACVLLLWTFKKRKSRKNTAKKNLKITKMSSNSQRKHIDSSRINKDFTTSMGRNELYKSNKNFNENTWYRYQYPIPGYENPNIEYLQRNGVLTQSRSKSRENPKASEHSSSTFWLDNHRQTLEPTNGKVMRNMLGLTNQMYLSPMAGIPNQLRVAEWGSPGLRPWTMEPVHSRTHCYNMQMPEAGGFTDCTDEIVTIPSRQICVPRDRRYIWKPLSRGHESGSAQHTIHRESECGSNQKSRGYSGSSQAGPEYKTNYKGGTASISEKFVRENRNEKKKRKERKSRKRTSKKSSLQATRFSSSEEEFTRTVSPKSSVMVNQIPVGTDESDGVTPSSSTDDRRSSLGSDLVYTSTSDSVQKVKKAKETWSEKDISRITKKGLESKNLKIVTKVKDNEKGSWGLTPRLNVRIPKEEATSGVCAQKSKSQSKSKSHSKVIQWREDTSAKVEKSRVGNSTAANPNSLGCLSTASSGLSDMREDLLHVLEHPNDPISISKMNEAALYMQRAGIKIPKNLKELQVWHNYMLQGTAGKYVIKKRLDAPPKALDMGTKTL